MHGRTVPGTCRENAGVVRTASDDRCIRTVACRQQRVQRALLQQRVAAGEQNDIELYVLHGLDADGSLVDTDPERPYGTCGSQLFQRAKAAAVGQLAKGGLVTISVGQAADVVDVKDIDAR